MSGSMSREWKRTVWQAPQARRTAPRHFLTLPTYACQSLPAHGKCSHAGRFVYHEKIGVRARFAVLVD